MTRDDFYYTATDFPMIAAVRDDKGLEEACSLQDVKIIFVLYGDICTIGDITNKISDVGKYPMVHVDLITGFSSKDIIVDFIKKNTSATGIISTKPALINRARQLNLNTVLRIFLIDSISLDNAQRQVHMVKPDFIEVLPGIMPNIIEHLKKSMNTPIIAGGLIRTKGDVVDALNAGAIAVSTTNPQVWKM